MRAFVSKYLFGRAAASTAPRLLSLQVVFPDPFLPTADSLRSSLRDFHPALRSVDFAATTYSDDETAAGEMIGRFKWSQAVVVGVPGRHRPAAASSPLSSAGSPSGRPTGVGAEDGGGSSSSDSDVYHDTSPSGALLTHRVSVVVKSMDSGLPLHLYRSCVEEPVTPVPSYEAEHFRKAMRTARSVAFLTYRTESVTAVSSHGGLPRVRAEEEPLVAPLHRRYEALTMVAASLCQQQPAVGVLNVEARTSAPAAVLAPPALQSALHPDGSVDLLSYPHLSSLYCGLHAVPSLNKPSKQLGAYRTSGGAALLGQPDFLGYAPSLNCAEAIRGTAALLWYDALRLGTPLKAEQCVSVARLVHGGGSVLLERPRLTEMDAVGGVSQNVFVLRASAGWRDVRRDSADKSEGTAV